MGDYQKSYNAIAVIGKATRDSTITVELPNAPNPLPVTWKPDIMFEINLDCGRIMTYYYNDEYYHDKEIPFPQSINIQNIGGCWQQAAEVVKLLKDGHMAKAFIGRHKHCHPAFPKELEIKYLLLCFGKTAEQEQKHQQILIQQANEETLKRKIDQMEDEKLARLKRRRLTEQEPLEKDAAWLSTKLMQMTRAGDDDATITAWKALDNPRYNNVMRQIEQLIRNEEMAMDEKEHQEYEAKLDGKGIVYRMMTCAYVTVDATKAEAASRLSEWFVRSSCRPLQSNTTPTPAECEMLLDVGYVKLMGSSWPALSFHKIRL